MRKGFLKIFFLGGLVYLAGILLGYGPPYQQRSKIEVFSSRSDRIKVISSFSILGDLIHQIGGDRVEVINIVGPDSDAHIFRPTPKTAQQIVQADMVFMNGLGFEGWIERQIEACGFKGPVVIATKGILPSVFVSSRKDKQAQIPDPHAWHSIRHAKQYIKNILESLVQFDPKHKIEYQKRARIYLLKLQRLDDWAKIQFEKVPVAKRKVLTAHDAFQYFAKDYNIKFLAPIGISTEAEASAQGVAQLIQQIKRESIKAVFIENISNTKLIEQIAAEAKVKIGGTLFSDALSKPEGVAPTYLKMMHYNISLLIKGMTAD
ncbi:MAG: metal ABC transporter substrate-binding protein [Alphaproteobacteria bacterium]|nr:metal ABC transporter substrate-binding protein [Alphaproteobacteria bacterium]